MEALPTKNLHGHHNGIVALAQRKEANSGQNGRCRPWEKFTPEAFAQHFHQAVLQSTHSRRPSSAHKCLSPATLGGKNTAIDVLLPQFNMQSL